MGRRGVEIGLHELIWLTIFVTGISVRRIHFANSVAAPELENDLVQPIRFFGR
jgi:hypothetical protein